MNDFDDEKRKIDDPELNQDSVYDKKDDEDFDDSDDFHKHDDTDNDQKIPTDEISKTATPTKNISESDDDEDVKNAGLNDGNIYI